MEKSICILLLTLLSLSSIAQNIAINKPASCSGYEYQNASYANNGNKTQFDFWSASNYPQWWQVDLQDNYSLTKLIVYTYWDGSRYYQYNIQGSLDNVTWFSLVDYSKNTIVATSAGNIFTIANVKARYIRINMTFNNANKSVHLVEFEAYGTVVKPLDCSLYQKTIDSLKTALGAEKVKSLTLDGIAKNLNEQVSYFSFKTDSLISALDHCKNPPIDSTTIKEILNQPVKYFSLKDTAYKTDMHIEQNFYKAIPYYKYQYITRFPVQTSEGIKTKEIILTQVQ
jgi:hypothetical protein